MTDTYELTRLDHDHVWHPFTAMRQWRQNPPLIIHSARDEYLIDTQGQRYIDGVSSLWCNVHGHGVPQIDQAIRDQLNKVAHTTLLGLASEPSIRLAARLVSIAPRSPVPESLENSGNTASAGLNKVFYSDSGATALEVAFKMAVGYWHHKGQGGKTRFIGLAGAYHGDTTGSMSVGYSDLFHRPFAAMVFPTFWMPAPDALRPPSDLEAFLRQKGLALCPQCQGRGHCGGDLWPSECPTTSAALGEYCLAKLDQLLCEHGHETAAVILEPVMQGAAGMICQPPGFVRGVVDLARRHHTLLIADEVAVGFGRTGKMFACEHDAVTPDILCLAKGITGGYLPLATTLATDEIYDAFCGELSDRRTLYHGHTYTGNALACAAALASLDLFESSQLLQRINANAVILHQRLNALRDAAQFPQVVDVRQRGLMVGIELGSNRQDRRPFDFACRTAAELCLAMRSRGLILRPLGDVLVLMPIPAMRAEVLHQMMDIVIDTLAQAMKRP